jgi:predicted transport protein
VLLTLKLDPDTVTFEEGFSRDVSQVGHWGTGDVELCIRTPEEACPAVAGALLRRELMHSRHRLALPPNRIR